MGKDLERRVLDVRKCLKSKLFGDEAMIGFAEEKAELLATLERTVRCGESNSLLVIGPRGSGKSLLVKTCLDELSWTIDDNDSYFVVHLHGLVHTNDNLGLKDIIRQLHVQQLEDGIVTGSFADNLLFVLQSLKSGNREVSKPIIFILEEFQLFCAHRNQTLLYNLFDIAQSAQAPVCVVGVTCRIDITEMLEKRVKSRFSHRMIFTFPSIILEERIDRVKEYLSLEGPKFRQILDKQFVHTWNHKVTKILEEPKVRRLIKYQLEIDPNERRLKNWIFLVVSRLTESRPNLDASIFEEVLENICTDGKVALLKDLSVLELCMIIAISHHNEIYDGEPFNFEMVAKQYLKFAAHNYSAVTQRPILFKAFERLKDLELIVPLSQGKNCKKEYQLYSFLITTQQIKEAISQFQGIPTDVAQWAASSLNSL